MTAVRSVQSPLLVGRDDALQLAERQLAEAAAGRGLGVLIAGEAGIGKSRLMWAIVRKAEALGFRVGIGALSPYDREVTLASILDMARGMRSSDHFRPLGADLLAIERDRGADTLGHRRLLVHEIAERILAAVDGPTLLGFDDLQWADELSLEVVGELARRAADRQLLVLGGYRLGELPSGSIHREWRARLLSQRLAEEVRLSPLTYDETAIVTTLILGTGLPAPREVVGAVFARTDGIPLHIEELLAALGDAERSDGRAIRDAHVPETIEDAVLARYARLSGDAQAVARACAVIGRCFIPEVAAGLLDRPVGDLDGPLQELVDQAFLYPFNYLDRGFYDFRHQLLRDALYETVQAGELRRLHARAAEFGGLIEGASEIHASVHFERAGMHREAYRAALAGARAANAVSSRREAFELYARAIANAPDDLPPDELAALHGEHCAAAFAVDDVPIGEESARLARRYHLAAGQLIEAAFDLVSLAGLARRDVRPVEERRRHLAEADAELVALPETPERNLVLSEVRAQQALIELDAVRLTTASALFDEARRLRLASKDPDTSDIDYLVAELEVLAGRTHPGLDTMLEIARQARSRRLESTGVTAFRWLAGIAVRVIDYPAATVALDEGLRYADEIEQSYCRHVLAATSAHVAWAAGRWDEAVHVGGQELVERGSRRGTLGSRDVLGFVAFGRGEVERARALLEDSLAIGRASGEVELVLPAVWGLAETALVAGEPGDAIARCETGLDLALATGERALLVPFVVTGVRAALAARRPDLAERWLERVTPLFAGWESIARPALDHADGLIRTSAGSTVTARTSLEQAVAGWDRVGRTWEGLSARFDLAACLLRANRDAEAIPVLREAVLRAEALSSAPLVERGRELLAVTRGRGVEEEPWRPLTAREFEVARLVADGLTNSAIGETLGLSPRTVGAHVEHILAKLSFTRRAEIAAWVASMVVAAGGVVGG